MRHREWYGRREAFDRSGRLLAGRDRIDVLLLGADKNRLSFWPDGERARPRR
jgi:hypothetical protein